MHHTCARVCTGVAAWPVLGRAQTQTTQQPARLQVPAMHSCQHQQHQVPDNPHASTLPPPSHPHTLRRDGPPRPRCWRRRCCAWPRRPRKCTAAGWAPHTCGTAAPFGGRHERSISPQGGESKAAPPPCPEMQRCTTTLTPPATCTRIPGGHANTSGVRPGRPPPSDFHWHLMT